MARKTVFHFPAYDWHYFKAQRPSQSPADVSLAQLGHMMDTLKDAILIMRHIGKNPHLEPQQDDHMRRYEDQRGVRPYVSRIASDLREAPTFTRPDLGRPSIAPEHPDLSSFMNHLHGLMRASSLIIGRSLVLPDSIAADAAAYDAAVQDYLALLDQHRNPANGQRDIRRVPREALDAFGQRFIPLADALCDKLEALDTIEVEQGGQRYRLPNHPTLNDQLPDCCAARMLFVLRTLGRGAADGNKRPAEWEYQGRVGRVIGQQSMITDSTQVLIDRMTQAGFPSEPLHIDRAKLTSLIDRYGHSFQLALAFMRTADCGYEALNADLALWATMAGAAPDAPTIESTADASLLLYAIERRIARDLPSDQAQDLRRDLRRCADRLNHDTAPHTLAAEDKLPLLLQRAEALAQQHQWQSVSDTIDIIRRAIPQRQASQAAQR